MFHNKFESEDVPFRGDIALEIDQLIQFLNVAKNSFSLTSDLPVELLLESFIDLSMMLSSCFKEGRKAQKLNPGIRFLDVADDLGNSLSIKTFKSVPPFFGDLEAKFFEEIAQLGVVVKNRDDLADNFMMSVEILTDSFPANFSKSFHNPKPKQKENPKETGFYYRRFRKRKRRH